LFVVVVKLVVVFLQDVYVLLLFGNCLPRDGLGDIDLSHVDEQVDDLRDEKLVFLLGEF